MKVFTVAGYSKTGKTTTATALITLLKKRGYRVAAIKDIHNESFSMETEGSNSHLMQLAGAEAVFARGLQETYLIRPQKMSLTEMMELLSCDWLVIEGMKKEPLPKIVTAASVSELDELVDGTAMCISGKISSSISEYKGLPVYSNLHEAEKLLDVVESKVFEVLPLADAECCGACGLSCYEMVAAILRGEKKREDCVASQKGKISLRINGKDISMVPFISKLYYDTFVAMISNLKGFKEGRIELELHT